MFDGSEVVIAGNTITMEKDSPDWTEFAILVGAVTYGSRLDVVGNEIVDVDDAIETQGITGVVNIADNLLRNNRYGVHVYSWISDDTDEPVQIYIEGNEFDGNEYGVFLDCTISLDEAGSIFRILENAFTGSTEFAVYNADGFFTVDATENWWGDETGPYHDPDNPDGEGDPVSDDVLFAPWYVDEGMTELSSP